MQNLKPIIIFLGPPGSGKGTQARMVAEKYGLFYLGSGDILREIAKESSERAKYIKECARKGILVSDEFITEIFIEKLKDILKRGVGAVLDGYPRNVEQAEDLAEALDENKNINFKVFLIDLDEDTATERMLKRRICSRCKESIPFNEETKSLARCPKCGGELILRKDDNEETVKNRLEVYRQETNPLIDFYLDSLTRIDGKPKIDEVFEEIVEKLK
ncbi:MAG: nucleoside monophosphate kinase [bacterium]